MRDIAILLLLIPLIYLSFRNGYIAFLLWAWAGLASLQSYAYGFMIGFPLVQLFAIVALTKFLVSKDIERIGFAANSTSVLFILFGVHITLCATFAIGDHPRNWELATNMLKTILFCLFMPMLVTSRFRIHALLLIIVIATGFHGLVDGLKFLASGGNHQAAGIPKFGDNNHYAMVLLMVIPLIAYVYKYSKNRLAKLGFLGMLPLLVLAVIATQSRGAFVCLIIMGMWFLLKSRRKFFGIMIIAACALLVFEFAPDHWVQRMDSIESASDDASFMGRVGAWQVSSAVAIQNPVFGGGPHAIEMGSVWDKYRQSPGLLGSAINMNLIGLPGRGRAAHSIYFETMGDLGFIGFFLFIAILINAFLVAKKIIKICRISGSSLDWARSLAEMLTLSALAYVVAGALLSAAYFELPYILFMLLEVVKQHVIRETTIKNQSNTYLKAPESSPLITAQRGENY